MERLTALCTNAFIWDDGGESDGDGQFCSEANGIYRGLVLTGGLCILDRYFSVYLLYSCPRPRTICGVTSFSPRDGRDEHDLVKARAIVNS